jgi:hypothetical protein
MSSKALPSFPDILSPHTDFSAPSSNLPAAHTHLSLLLPLSQISDPDLSHQISLLEIDLLMHPSGPNLPKAYQKISSLLAEKLDLAHTLHLLTLKAAVFAAAGKPEKGFSIAVRAASRAERAGLLPVLLEALAALAEILNKVGEFGASRELAEAALPQVCVFGLCPLQHSSSSSRQLSKFANTPFFRLSNPAPQVYQPASSSSSRPASPGWRIQPSPRVKPSGQSS